MSRASTEPSGKKTRKEIQQEADQVTIRLGLNELECSYWKHFGRPPHYAGGIRYIYSLIDHPMYNGILDADWSTTNPKEGVADLLNYFKENQNRDFVWWSDKKHEPVELSNLLLPMHIGLKAEYVGMAQSIADFDYEEPKKEIEFERIKRRNDLDPWCEVWQEQVQFSQEAAEAFLLMMTASNLEGGYIHLIMRHKGKVVGIGSILVDVVVSSLHHFVILDQYKGLGFEKALLQELVSYADFMKRRFVLVKVLRSQAEDYKALGFNEHVEFNLWGRVGQ